ncbi:amidohydrolase [Seiridium cupressi]
MDPSDVSTSTAINLEDDALLRLIARNASKLLDAGVTTCRDLGSRGWTTASIRDQISRSKLAGPRIQCANAPLTVPGGHAALMGGVCEGVEGVRAEVRKRAQEGADLIKVMSTDGFMTAGSHPSQARFSPDEMAAIRDEATKHGLSITTHATGKQGIDRAADAHFDCIEHCAWINPDSKAEFDPVVAQKFVDGNIAVCPTMNTACISQCYFCPWDERPAIVDNLEKMREIGIRLVTGTDSGIGLCRFERYADGLTVLADAGYTSREIIAASTEAAAEVCGLERETGRLEGGFAADLAAFAGNPLEDVTAYREPRFVMALGREHELSPIEPLGDIKEKADLTLKLLREGAGIKK